MPETVVSILSTTVLLFFLMDPIGNIPVLISILKGIELKRQRQIILRELLFALAILLVFLFSGESLLNFLQLQKEAVALSGGIVLLIIGLRLIFPSTSGAGVMGHQLGGEPFLVPIAVPMIAGPSVLAMLMLITQSKNVPLWQSFLALMLAWLISFLVLWQAPLLLKIFKERGLIALERLMGMILVMMAVQMLIDGVRVLF